MYSTSLLKKFLVILVVSTLVTVLVLTDYGVLSQQYPSIPFYTDIALPLPTTNAGPGAPLVLKPGECSILLLRDEYSNVKLAWGYIWRVDYVNGKPSLLNYTINLKQVGVLQVGICIPENVEEGLYDLVLTGDAELVIPRSIWIVSSLPRRLRVVVLSDLHFGVIGKPDLWRYSAALIANTLSPDVVIWAGDIQDVDSDHYAMLAQTYRYMLFYRYPVFSVPGNHDNPGARYSKYIGPARWARAILDKILIVGVYTNPYPSPGNIITWDEIMFLEEALRNYSYISHKIVVFHYPMFFCNVPCTVEASYDDEEVLKPYAPGVETPVSSYWSGNMTAFRYVLKLMEDYNVTAVIAGHIHRDQYILYTSRRTGSKTHFITVTSSGQTSATYPGVRAFEVDLETGEIRIVEYPNVGINSVPVEYGGVGVKTLFIRGLEAYKFAVQNMLPWFNISFNTIIVLPWAPRTIQPRLKVLERGENTAVKATNLLVTDKLIYMYLEVNIPRGEQLIVVVYREEDTRNPIIKLSEWTPEVPRLNRTFTLYIDVADDHWGIDPLALIITTNCTVRLSTRIIPETYIAVFNKAIIEIRFTPASTTTMTCRIDVSSTDNANYTSTKSFLVVFYPPGVTPTEQPVRELVEQLELTTPYTQTTQAPGGTPTIPTTQIPETTPREEITVSKTFTVTETFTETETTRTKTPSVEEQATPVNLSSIIMIIVIVGFVAVLIIILLKR